MTGSRSRCRAAAGAHAAALDADIGDALIAEMERGNLEGAAEAAYRGQPP
jgi:hypothetical protein